MKIRIEGELVDVADELCPARPCYQLGFDKGTFTPGIGYRSYYPGGPRHVCWTRHLSGCPHTGVHLKCGTCQSTIGEARPYDAKRDDAPVVCEVCGAIDLYWLADVLPDPKPCCATPDFPKIRLGHPFPSRQRCRSCGTVSVGKLLNVRRAMVAG